MPSIDRQHFKHITSTGVGFTSMSVSLVPWYKDPIGYRVLSYPDGTLLTGPDNVEGARAELAEYGLSALQVTRVEVRPGVAVLVAEVQTAAAAAAAGYVNWEESDGLPNKEGCLDAGWRTIPVFSPAASSGPAGGWNAAAANIAKATLFLAESATKEAAAFSWADIMPSKKEHTT
jgi:hypothetical protein